MTRRPLIAGNWKMNGDIPRTCDLCAALLQKTSGWGDIDIAVFPPFVSLSAAAGALKGSRIMLGAQNMHDAASGAYTCEVSAGMLLTVGCQLVILGHSERRKLFGEIDADVNRKTHAALTAGLKPIVCVGETLEEREAGATQTVVGSQLTGSLQGLDGRQLKSVTIAYEPVWAIGTGKVATVEQAGEVHQFIRAWLRMHHGAESAERTRIQYGGSVKAENAKGLLSHPDIDGALVGGASLDANEFDAIVRSAV